MLKGKVTYLRPNHIKGISQKTGGEYEFANIEVSFGLESRKLPLDLNLLPLVKTLNYGDKLELDVEVEVRGNDTNIIVKKLTKVG